MEQSLRALRTSATHSSIALSEGKKTLSELSGYPSLGKYLSLPEPDALNTVQAAERCCPRSHSVRPAESP